MRVLILVGGLGTRLRPLTNDRPKPMVPIAGEPLMTRTLRRLRELGVTEVTLAVQYLADRFRAAYGTGTAFAMNLQIIEEPEPLGTGGALRYALDQTGGIPGEPIIVLNGDELSTLDVNALWDAHHAVGGVATIATRTVPDPSAFGVVVADAWGRVTAFQEKPAFGNALANTINSGAYVLTPTALEHIPQGRFWMIERDLFPVLLSSSNAQVFAWHNDAYSQDIGTLPGYLAANAAMLTNSIANQQPVGTQLAAGIWADGPVAIHPSVTLVAPIMLGAGTIVEAGAYLERVVTWERVTIGTDATVREAVLTDQTAVPAGALVFGVAVNQHSQFITGT